MTICRRCSERGLRVQIGIGIGNMKVEARQSRKGDLEPERRHNVACQATRECFVSDWCTIAKKLVFHIARSQAIKRVVENGRIHDYASISPAFNIR